MRGRVVRPDHGASLTIMPRPEQTRRDKHNRPRVPAQHTHQDGGHAGEQFVEVYSDPRHPGHRQLGACQLQALQAVVQARRAGAPAVRALHTGHAVAEDGGPGSGRLAGGPALAIVLILGRLLEQVPQLDLVLLDVAGLAGLAPVPAGPGWLGGGGGLYL